MKEPLRRLLLLPLLAPLVVVLLVGALQPKPLLQLRLLVWTTPALPAGAWLAGAGLLGAALSAGGTALALRGGAGAAPAARAAEPWDLPRQRERPWPAEAAAQPPQQQPAPPPRAPGDPPPTVSVPYRVVRRGTAAPASTAGPVGATATGPVASGTDDWANPAPEEW
ncbi:MAG: hypothetical protein ACKO5F_03770 [Synechococcus sp.]